MNGPDRQTASLLAALALLWCVGLFGRVYWTPDEPREAALSASVSTQALPLPRLDGAPFAEKPPLTYWLAGAAMRVFGAQPAAARAPQLGYALLAFIAVLALLRRALGNGADAGAAAWCGAALFATMALVYQVQVWLDTDALLLAGVCVALAGMYHALGADGDAPEARRARWLGYLAMHAGLTLAFFAKNFAAWLVPVLAFLCFIAWERRWRELWRAELWTCALLPAAAIALWVSAVAALPDGVHLLRILFWNNLTGRALPIAMEARYDYASGHRNSPGRYLFELPLYLLPWTVVAAYALEAAWRGARGAGGARRAAWRFAACAALPGLLVLSLATTARSIYAAPCLVGFAMLMALAIDRLAVDAAAMRRVLIGTAVLLLLLSLAVLALNAALQWSALRAPWPLYLLGSCTAAAIAAWCGGLCLAPAAPRAPRAPRVPATARVQQFAIAWCLLLSLGLLCAGRAVNRAQDLDALARRIAFSAGAGPVLLWNPDETTRAWAQLYLPAGSWRSLESAGTGGGAVAELPAVPANGLVVSLAPGRWSREQWLAYLRGERALSVSGADEPILSAAGFSAIGRVERPGGRGYFLWRQTAAATHDSGAMP
ncbi:MAG TPA: glycosyltransferase family 39 protein [Steroidobacteraceae bacterium]|nr:glycosyltransferase family 39 protein [Steroidobacteraceae bacterium]